MRLIDADKLLRDIEHYNLSDGKFQHWVEIQPTVEPEPHWIPCSERLPEPRIDVWCNSDLGQMVGFYDETTENWYKSDYSFELIVDAWMPLPEPYQPDGFTKWAKSVADSYRNDKEESE